MEAAQEMSSQTLPTDSQEAAASNMRMLESPSEGPHGKRCKNEEQDMASPDNASGKAAAPASNSSGAKMPRTKGPTLCEHQRVRRRCKDCGGSGLCEHQRVRSKCKDCGGSSFCQHQRLRRQCKDCGGGGICEHQRQRGHCKDCRKLKDKAEEKEKGKEREPEQDVEHGGHSAGDQCQLQIVDRVEERVKGTKQSESCTYGIDKILTKHTSQGVDSDKTASGDTVQTLSDGGGAGTGVGDHGRGVEDKVSGQKVQRAVSHDLEGNGGNNASSKSQRSDSAPHKGWREYIAVSGRLYYHHKATKTTQWMKPF